MHHWDAAVESFLLSFPALFSIVNPFGGALIYAQVTRHWSHDTRLAVAARIGIYSLLVMSGALWGDGGQGGGVGAGRVGGRCRRGGRASDQSGVGGSGRSQRV